MPIVGGRGARRAYPRLGRVSLGYAVVKVKTDGTPALGRDGKPITYPKRSSTFVFHTDNQVRAEAIAVAYGGTPEQAVASDDEGGAYRVITQATQIECFLPAADERGFDDWMEKWGSGGLLRKCDGQTAVVAIDPESGEIQRDVPCVCDALGLEGDDRCDPVTRMSVVIPALAGTPGLGVWQVQSRGWATHSALSSAVDLLRRLGAVEGVPVILRVEQRKVRSGDEGGKAQTRGINVITLDSRLSFTQVLAARGEMRALVSPEPVPSEAREVELRPEPVFPDAPVESTTEGVDQSPAVPPSDAPVPRSEVEYRAELGAKLFVLSYDDNKARALSLRVTGKSTRGEYGPDDYETMIAITTLMKEKGLAEHDAISEYRQHRMTSGGDGKAKDQQPLF